MDKYQIRWKNFRGFKDTGWIKLRPITVILGANNSGKTSLLAPLLLLKQSHEADEEGALKIKGPLLNAGTFEDIVTDHQTRKHITLGVRFHHHDLADLKKSPPVGEVLPGALELTFAKYSNSSRPILKKYQVSDACGRHLLSRERNRSESYSVAGLNYAKAKARTKLKNPAFDRALRKNIREAIPYQFLFNDVPFSETLRTRKSSEKGTETSAFAREYLKIVESVSDSMFAFFGSIGYIGPLRERPQRFYELSGAMPEDVGTRGEFAPEMIHRLRDTGFIKVVQAWLARFGFSGHLNSQSLGEGAFSLTVGKRKGGLLVNFADTGFGLSQVLPLIVQGFYSQFSKDLVIAEQPEIHLNPKLQAVLADLFCEIAKAGVVTLIETHSEHLILRLRRLVAEGEFQAEDVALYYVERRGDQSFIREVAIQENGAIRPSDWPQGFFGESLKDALALAAAQSRSRKK